MRDYLNLVVRDEGNEVVFSFAVNLILRLKINMVRNCVVGKCKTNYKSELKARKKGLKISVYKFPKDATRQLWIDALPNILRKKVTDHVGICALYWPQGFDP